MQSDTIKEKGALKPRSYSFAIAIVGFIDKLNQKDLSVQTIAKQLLRSATSIGANIVEAQAGSSKKDFTNFYSYALKSANETKFWLGLLIDTDKVDAQQAEKLLKEVTELSNMLGSSVITLKSNKS